MGQGMSERKVRLLTISIRPAWHCVNIVRREGMGGDVLPGDRLCQHDEPLVIDHDLQYGVLHSIIDNVEFKYSL